MNVSKRIWANQEPEWRDGDGNSFIGGTWDAGHFKEGNEYIRIDLAPPQWQPIETAPENTPVDLFVKGNDGRRPDMIKKDGKWYGRCKLFPTDVITHWMPRPEPPK